MQRRIVSALLFAALVAVPVWAGKKGQGGGHSAGASSASTSTTHTPTGVTGASTSQLVGGGSSGTQQPATMSGYHSSAGYGSLYGWGYNGWTKNGWHDGQWHGIPYSDKTSPAPAKRGGSSASTASASETELIQQQVAQRRAQQAQQSAAPSQPAAPVSAAHQP